MFKDRYPHITTLAAYGCSITAGAELADYMLDPKAELIKRRRGFEYWWDFITSCDPKLLDQWRAAEQASAWPKLTADLMDLKVVNRAAGGTSLGLSLWLFYEDVLFGRLDPKTTLFVFGVTNPQRIHLFKPSPITTLRVGAAVGQPKNWCKATITDIFTDSYLLWNHLQLLERISVLAQRMDLNIAAFNMFPNVPLAEYRIDRNELRLMQYQYDLVNAQKGFFFAEPGLEEFIRPEERMGCGHPNHAVHARYAQHVAQCLNRL